MRTNIEIDDGLIAEAMRRGGHPTRKAAVEEGLSLLVGLARQREAAQALWGLELDWSLEGPPAAGLHEDQAPLR
jgi:Arc/MetJ family transcription regulator